MLEQARDLGFLGPGPVETHLDHAGGFAEAVLAGDGREELRRGADLGSGGGVPGLVLALRFPDMAWVLIEAGARRAAFLRGAIERLGLDGRTTVVEERAELVGRAAAHRAQFDVVVARGFGPPPVVAECAAPLLRVGGRAVVSEPPGGAPGRWPAEGLALVGLSPAVAARTGAGAFQVLQQVGPCPDRYPRRVGMPAKRPIF